jgi:hypothetical protein
VNPEVKAWYYYWLCLKVDAGLSALPAPKLIWWACSWAGLNTKSPVKMKLMFRALGFDPDLELGIVHINTNTPQQNRPSFRRKKVENG